MDSQSLEWSFLWASVLCSLAKGYLFTLKLSDLLQVRREGQNGPILYMTRDKVRHQAFMLAVSVGMAMLAVSSVNNPEYVSTQAKNLLFGGLAFALLLIGDAMFTFRRRAKLPELVAKYEAGTTATYAVVAGGKRPHDPPKE
jgi:uncharacterized membrane protein YedE/YeeE